jgi:hypothetical protein
MYYLVIENLGRKRCIDKHETNVYKDYQFYDCLRRISFEEKDRILVSTIKIRCVRDPYTITEAYIYSD